MKTKNVEEELYLASEIETTEQDVLSNVSVAEETASLYCVSGSGSDCEDCESNSNTWQTAHTLTLSQWMSESLVTEIDEIWFKFTTNSSVHTYGGTALYTIQTRGGVDTDGELYADPNAEPLVYKDDGGAGYNFLIQEELSYNQTYYVRVMSIGPDVGDFEICVTATAINTDSGSDSGSGSNSGSGSDCNGSGSDCDNSSGSDCNSSNSGCDCESGSANDRDTAYTLPLSTWVGGSIVNETDAVWFKFTTNSSVHTYGGTALYTIQTRGGVDTDGELYADPNAEPLVYKDDGGAGYNFLIQEELSYNQTYYVKVMSVGTDVGDFEICVDASAVDLENDSYSGCCGSCENCESNSNTVDTPIAVESIKIHQNDFTVNVGQTKSLCAIISPSNATDRRVRWHSNNSSIACVNYYTGVLKARTPGKVTITATSVDGAKTDSITVTVIIDTVTIEKDGNFNRVIFHSTGKIWRCLNHDLIYTDRTQGDPEEQVLYDDLWIRSNYNFFTYFEEGIQNPDTTPKEYTDDEIKLLYAIDPYGVAHYVQRYATARDGTLEACLEYKDRIFQLLFKREPKYFARTLSGEWYETTDKSDLTDVLSESEEIFGMHPIYDQLTWINLCSIVLDIFGIAFGTPFFKDGAIKKCIGNIGKVFVLVLSVGEAAVKNELISEFMNNVVAEALDKTPLKWAFNCVSLYNDISELADSIIAEPNYCGRILNYCANDTGYSVFLKLNNGQMHGIDELCDAIKE